MTREEYTEEFIERIEQAKKRGWHPLAEPQDKPIDWRKVAARIRSDGEDAQRQLADQRDTETVTAVATIVIMCQILAAAIEDGLS